MPAVQAVDERMVPVTGAVTLDTAIPRWRRTGRSLGSGAGIGIGLLSAMCFGTSGTFGSALEAAGWSPAGAVLARVLVAALVLTIPAARSLHGRWWLLRRNARQVIAYGLVGVAACQLGYYIAIAHMDVGISILLEYLSVLFVVAWLWLRHGQRPRLLTVFGGIAALSGLGLMLDLSGSGGLSVVGVLAALAAAVAAAVYFFQSAAPVGVPESEVLPPVALTWGGMLAGGATIAVLGAARVTPLRFSAAPVTLFNAQVSWIMPVLGLGVIAAAIAYVTGIAAVRSLGPKLGSFIAMAEVLFAAGFAWVLLHQVPTGMQFVGGLLILAGVVAVRLDES
jgi:drug/metabolite transporter (DMT)-like permease